MPYCMSCNPTRPALPRDIQDSPTCTSSHSTTAPKTIQIPYAIRFHNTSAFVEAPAKLSLKYVSPSLLSTR